MNREEFLRGLGASLNGAVPPSVIQENLRYYDEYIRSEVARGRSEEEVIDEIGGYRLIAKTIIEANGGENQDSGGYGSTGGEEYYGGAYRDEYGGNGSGPYSGTIKALCYDILSCGICQLFLARGGVLTKRGSANIIDGEGSYDGTRS